MTIQKDQKPIINAMLRTQFTDVIYDSICILLAKRVNEMLNCMTVKSEVKLSSEEEVELKKQYFIQILKEDRVKKDLMYECDEIMKRKTDLLAEILKQYGMANTSESTYYHDFLQNTFDGQLWRIRSLIRNNCMGDILK